MMPDSQTPSRIAQIARAAEFAATLALLLLFGAACYGGWLLATANPSVDIHLQSSFLPGHAIFPLDVSQRWIGTLLFGLDSVLIAIALWVARSLFASYRQEQVFTLANAARLRLIGWLITLSTPLSIAAQTFGRMLFSLWQQPGQLVLSIGVGREQILMLVFGLLLVVVGHVSFKAMQLEAENKAFV